MQSVRNLSKLAVSYAPVRKPSTCCGLCVEARVRVTGTSKMEPHTVKI